MKTNNIRPGELLETIRTSVGITGTRIDYLDDLGFWAFGAFNNGRLDHVGYRFNKRS